MSSVFLGRFERPFRSLCLVKVCDYQ